MVQNINNNQKSDKGWEISGKYDILTVEEELIPLIGKSTKIRLEMTLKQREIEMRRFNVSKVHIKKQIEKEKYLFPDIGGKIMLKVLTSEASKGY